MNEAEAKAVLVMRKEIDRINENRYVILRDVLELDPEERKPYGYRDLESFMKNYLKSWKAERVKAEADFLKKYPD